MWFRSEGTCKAKSWIDEKHIGITGCSYGGFETMWLITRSDDLFAAAFAEVGCSDMTLEFFNEPDLTLGNYGRIGATPWEKPELYIENSPIYFANKIKTPLGLMNNNQDAICPLPQGIEMFLALRQLDKPVWLLQYENQGHGVGHSFDKTDIEVTDYRKRYQEFLIIFKKEPQRHPG